jgi:putative endonuclease
MSRTYFVYILASESRELYIGVTNNLQRRVAQHRAGADPGSYSSEHGTTSLVYYEMTSDVLAAIGREKRLKRLSRSRKLCLIDRLNPEWQDLMSHEGQR